MNGHGVEQDFRLCVRVAGHCRVQRQDGGRADGRTMLEHLAERRLTTEQLTEAEARVRAWNRDRR